MDILNTSSFAEHVIRSFLGKYQNRFHTISDKSSIVLITDPNPLLAVQLAGPNIGLYEYIDIEEDDPFYGTFDHYCIEIITISVSDPTASKRIEAEVGKTLLAGTRNKF